MRLKRNVKDKILSYMEENHEVVDGHRVLFDDHVSLAERLTVAFRALGVIPEKATLTRSHLERQAAIGGYLSPLQLSRLVNGEARANGEEESGEVKTAAPTEEQGELPIPSELEAKVDMILRQLVAYAGAIMALTEGVSALHAAVEKIKEAWEA